MTTVPSLLNQDAISPLPVLKQDTDLHRVLDQFKTTLEQANEDNRFLDVILNTAAKNLPAYIKIIKSHLEQLVAVLRLDSHHNQQLDYHQLPEPLQQLVQLFQHLAEDDLTQIEWLAREAQQWTTEALASDKALSPLTEGV